MPPRTVERCFRVLDIPLTWNSAHATKQLAPVCKAARATIVRFDLYPGISPKQHKQVGILVVSGSDVDLKQFAQVEEDDLPRTIKIGGDTLHIDISFYGLTPLNTTVGEVTADVVAVTGLAAHAYGSWKDRATGQMWLQDFLPKSLNNRVRVMTYGYKTPLVEKSDIKSEMHDYFNDLTAEITTARESVGNRPLIIIGHSLGGILVGKLLLHCDLDKKHKHIADATRLVMFFGAPHGGLRTKELLDMVAQSQDTGASAERSRRLLELLRIDSAYLLEHKTRLKRILDDRKPITFYETAKTATVGLDPATGKWGRNGPVALMVERASAEIFARREDVVPIARDHSEITKFSSTSDEAYRIVLARVDSFAKTGRRP